MHAVCGGGVLVDHFVMHGPQNIEPVENFCTLGKMLADLRAADGCVDRVIIRAGFFFLGLGVAFALGVPGIDVTRATPKPNHNAMLGLAFGESQFLLRLFGRKEASG